MNSKTIRIVLISPEVLKKKDVIQTLLTVRNSFVIKCIDEAHLFMIWGVQKSKGQSFRPAMQLSTGELERICRFSVWDWKHCLNSLMSNIISYLSLNLRERWGWRNFSSKNILLASSFDRTDIMYRFPFTLYCSLRGKWIIPIVPWCFFVT